MSRTTAHVVSNKTNEQSRLAHYLQEAGFYKEREISLPHKQSNLFKINRDVWKAPAL